MKKQTTPEPEYPQNARYRKLSGILRLCEKRATDQEARYHKITDKTLAMAIYSGSILAFAAAVAAFTGGLAGGECATVEPDWFALRSFVGIVVFGIAAAFFALGVAWSSNWCGGPTIGEVGEILGNHTPEEVIKAQIAAYREADSENQKIISRKKFLFACLLCAVCFETIFLGLFIVFTFFI